MPSEQKMLFFTPELYLRYNSHDDNLALAADAEWEAAIRKYHEHLTTMQEKMPSQVMELSRLCLHDGEILRRQESQHPLGHWGIENWLAAPRLWPFWYGVATLAVRLDDELVTLFYFLCDHISEQPASEDWPFSKKHEHWLYDEVHRRDIDSGTYAHLILLSSGVVLTIPFGTVLISRFGLSPSGIERSNQNA
jgi:hypothetical protein